jgi:hypothetical protein
MNVASNVAGIVTGNGITTGNIEFWNGNYSNPNANNIPNASAVIFDFGDQMTAGGHGCLQIHNYGASQTIMAYSNWGANAGQISDLGIGNYPTPSATASGAQLDWTFASNAATYTTRNLYVLVRPGGTATGNAPTFASHPISRIINVNGSTTLSALASGAAPLHYQWRKNGAPISGATNPWFQISSATLADAGSYDVVVTSNTFTTATSLPATIDVNRPPVANGYNYGVLKNQTLDFTTAELLALASDLDGDVLTISSVSTATLSPIPGGYRFDAGTDFVGASGYSVTYSDGRGGFATAVVNITVSDIPNPATVQTTIARNGDGSVDIGFHGIPGRTYFIQRSIDLITWTTIQTLAPAPDGNLPVHDSNAPTNKAFYRTVEQ